MITVNGFWQMSTMAGLTGEPTIRVLENFDPAATPPLIIEPMRTLSPSEVLEQFVSSNDAYLDVISTLDSAGWSTLGESPAAMCRFDCSRSAPLWDCWVHEPAISPCPSGSHRRRRTTRCFRACADAAALSPAFAISSGDTIRGVYAVDDHRSEVPFAGWRSANPWLSATSPHRVHAPCLHGGRGGAGRSPEHPGATPRLDAGRMEADARRPGNCVHLGRPRRGVDDGLRHVRLVQPCRRRAARAPALQRGLEQLARPWYRPHT